MEIVRKTLRPIGHAAHLFFRSQLRLRVRGGLRLEFVERDGRRTQSPEELAEIARRRELSLMLGELAQCLDADPDIRPELRHLAFVETVLRQQGLSALDSVPLHVLRTALEQFEGLVSNWTPRGLATLRSKMAVTLGEREASGEEATSSASRSLSEPSA